jgi:hypothetical protein
MKELIAAEVDMVSGGEGKGRRYDVVPDAQSEYGRLANDISNAAGEAGSSLGIAIYDWFH